MFTTTSKIAASVMVALGVLAFAAMTNEPCIRAAPVPEPAWKAEFRRAYGLEGSAVLKRVDAPFPACRKQYYQTVKANTSPDSDSDDVVMNYRWDGKKVEVWALTGKPSDKPVGWSLINVLGHLGLPPQEVEGDGDLLHKHIEGEFVVRTGASAEKVVPRLEQILREELKLPIRLTLRRVEREVIVVGGKYESKPRANRKMNQVDLFATEPNEEGGAGGGSGTFDEFLIQVGSYISRRLVNDLANSPKGRITWFYHNSTIVLPGPDPNQDAEGVLKKVTAQTGLTFKTETRKVPVLFVKSE
jgi:hypothetical protein